ncbi:hypothetical protein HPULCUR_000937 [Helicostylum pulchrum]|uniref:Sulfotransferase family protein n=1 Tax=Helicostylum pulchrum TaxID=562976 RepID=A0ABP9XLB8_9FUNG
MAPFKVIGAGFGRTGTESLRFALDILGYNTHHMKCFFNDLSMDCNGFYDAYYNREEADWDRLFEGYDAVTNFSVTFYYDLYKKYLDAKVTLTVRSDDSWYTFIKNTTFWAAKEFPKPQEGTREFDVLSLTQNGLFRRDHIEGVKNSIPKDQLLVVELDEG